MALYKTNNVPITFIRNSVGLLKTTLEANSKAVAQVTIKCAMCQDDALYPLLFCIEQIHVDSGVE